MFLLIYVKLQTYADWAERMPVTLLQPNGQIIECYVSGDEYYNWYHDERGYTIIQDSLGYYCYAINKNGVLHSSNISATQKNIPDTIMPNIQPDSHVKARAYMAMNNYEQHPYKFHRDTTFKSDTTRILNNIVIFIRFSDQNEFSDSLGYFNELFNSNTTASLKTYYKEVSYNGLEILSSFYPLSPNGITILSYQDTLPRDYYCVYSATNPIGFIQGDYAERKRRENTLLRSAILFVKNQIPSTLNIDSDNDGRVDNICFIIQGNTNSELLWPHKSTLSSPIEYINGKQVHNYNLQIINHIHSYRVGVLAHEMGHTLGAPDLYHAANDSYPVGVWDVMAYHQNVPQHMGAYIKYRYLGFIDNIPEITSSGNYSIYPLSTHLTDNCYKIPISGTSEYLVVEYRKKLGIFDYSIPKSGLLIYRINPQKNGNYNAVGHGGANDEIYVFRVDGSLSSDGITSDAPFSKDYERAIFYNNTNPNGFISNGTYADIYIKNISACGNKITFDVRFCDDENIIISNTSNIPNYVNASNSITTENSVVVTSTDDVKLEAGNTVTLTGGFSVELGGNLEVNINPCGNQ